MTSLFNISMQETKQNLFSKMHAMTSDISSELKALKDEVNQVSSIAVEMASGSPMCSNPMLAVDIIDELKSLSANINSFQSKHRSSSPDSIGSLENELDSINNIQEVIQSGWRRLGTRNVWKADWTDYDRRKLNRVKQQKQADAARKRRNQANNNNKNVHPNNESRPSPRNNDNNHHHNNNHTSMNQEFNFMRGHGSSCSLPPDRILLAAAKERFSRQPEPSDSPNTHRPILFQRGEILNPYPLQDDFRRNQAGCSSNDVIGSCNACHARHSCFRRH